MQLVMNTNALDPTRQFYVSLATYRRDGREVRTPVWIAAADGAFYVFSAAAAGKVKRIRLNGRAKLAACTVRGRVTGPWRPATARLIDDPSTCARALGALRAKYGWQMWLADGLAKLGGRFEQRCYIELQLP